MRLLDTATPSVSIAPHATQPTETAMTITAQEALTRCIEHREIFTTRCCT